ncbi:hypothetical protein ACFRH4_05865 [Streptomyces mirabilis]|uniref:hypothetical protein n=1 Tax=Streptomyces mirabilis TaxID=68239 RepID=UPI0036C25AC3
MAADRRRGRRVATLATTLATVALTAGLATGCDGVDNSLDCLQNADTIGDKTDDGKVDKLDKAVADYNKAILNGDTNPDSSKINDAAEELKNVCTS